MGKRVYYVLVSNTCDIHGVTDNKDAAEIYAGLNACRVCEFGDIMDSHPEIAEQVRRLDPLLFEWTPYKDSDTNEVRWSSRLAINGQTSSLRFKMVPKGDFRFRLVWSGSIISESKEGAVEQFNRLKSEFLYNMNGGYVVNAAKNSE